VASVQDSIVIPAGGASATFTITTKVVSATVKKTARDHGGGGRAEAGDVDGHELIDARRRDTKTTAPM